MNRRPSSVIFLVCFFIFYIILAMMSSDLDDVNISFFIKKNNLGIATGLNPVSNLLIKKFL